MKEIYRIKHKNYKSSLDIACVLNYTLGVTGLTDGEELTPKKITILKGRVRVEFEELGIVHEFAYTDDVEIFRRDKIKEDAQETTD